MSSEPLVHGPGHIEVRGARENNLRDVDLDVPKRAITVFTGVSGSGKSSLVFDTIAAESRRLLQETLPPIVQTFLPSYGRPDIDSLDNLSAAIVVDQSRMGGNSRSTVGTATDTYAMLRHVWSRLGEPHAGSATAFSFNDPQGMCPECEGIGRVSAIDLDELLDRDLSLAQGAIRFPTFAVDTWYWQIFAQSRLVDPDKPLRDYTPAEWDVFLDGPETKVKVDKHNLTYEGLRRKFRRLYAGKEVDQHQSHLREPLRKILTRADCPACGGTRLNDRARASLVAGRSITDCAAMQVSDLAEFVRGIDAPTVGPMLATLGARLDELTHIGLGYLSLDRESATLSGGESQRVKMVRHLGSSLTDLTYVFDEPSIGLHPHDVHRLNELLIALRDKGNTVLVVEHKPDVIAIADHVVDMGPGAGRGGGEVVYQGDLAGLLAAGTRTGRHMGRRREIKASPRTPTGELRVEHASRHNLRDVSVSVPTGVLTVVTGVAGSGKSTLVLGHLVDANPDVVTVDQSITRGSRRSNTATYTGILDAIRKAFAAANKVQASLFSANSKGACPTCSGLGVVYAELAHLEPVATECEECEGRRFTAEVLAHTLRGKSIADVYDLSISEAVDFFPEKAIAPTLRALVDVGLGYLTLGQPLSTLSGGERQRVKLAIELQNTARTYVLDEPTTGLHMDDVDNLVGLLDRFVDEGSTVIVIEHNLDVVAAADWVIDLGPGAGHDGGTIVFEGTPAELAKAEHSLTGRHLARRLATGSAGARAAARV